MDKVTVDILASSLGLTLFGKQVLKQFMGEKPCFFCRKPTSSTIEGTDGTVYPYCGCRKLM